jgi:FKBP-type peptidyl-prolyl cis-trans isomerase FkpA
MKVFMNSSSRPLFSVLSLMALVACGAGAKIEETTFAEKLNVDLGASTKLPSGMYIRETPQGGGAEAKKGAVVTVRYTGWLANGRQFDSNPVTGFKFNLGAGEVIAGWDLGVEGMKVGGTRQLIIPPKLAYGASGNGPIPGDSVLVFLVTMVETR